MYRRGECGKVMCGAFVGIQEGAFRWALTGTGAARTLRWVLSSTNVVTTEHKAQQ